MLRQFSSPPNGVMVNASQCTDTSSTGFTRVYSRSIFLSRSEPFRESLLEIESFQRGRFTVV